MPCPIFSCPDLPSFAPVRSRLDQRRDPGMDVEAQVRDVLDTVRQRGDDALVEYTRRFDCPGYTAENLTVPAAAIQTARAAVPAADLAIIEQSAANVRRYHERQVEKSWWTTEPDGTILGQMVRPVDRVGLYVPGGQGGETPLISSLIMNAVPARVAGVREILVASPPRKDGSLNPYILATAAVLGIERVHPVGSAWAIAALAFGTRTIAPCHVIAGPGNLYVATAKALLTGRVGIDMVAGPSEIVILADATANPDWIAADMLSQAEHDPLAAALCITTSAPLAEALKTALARRLAELPRAAIAEKSLAHYGAIVIAPDLDAAVGLVNEVAPEHLELAVAEPFPLLGKIRHAGAIFLGHHCPEPVGDYFAGPNHVLPTLGTARFSSALSVQNFCKKSSIIATSPDYVAAHGDKIARLARLEGLEAHARSVEARTRKERS
ncbi:MAG: histidinol dehydrogenase [Desulfovibrionaceae bacterium]